MLCERLLGLGVSELAFRAGEMDRLQASPLPLSPFAWELARLRLASTGTAHPSEPYEEVSFHPSSQGVRAAGGGARWRRRAELQGRLRGADSGRGGT